MAQSKRRQKHIPQRTCIGCRRKRDKRKLTRLVYSPDAGVVVDSSGKRAGRGAYLCDDPECWDKVLNSQLLDQALHVEISATAKTAIAEHKPITVPTYE